MSDRIAVISRAQWVQLKRDLADLKAEIAKASRQERAEVAGSVPVYATTGDLPTAGKLGRLASVRADGLLYHDNGTSWVAVTT